MATLALNAGEWFRRGRLLIFCAPENTGSILAHRSSSSTYRRVQFCATTSQPTAIGTSRDWVKLTAGAAHTMALRVDGSLSSWGRNASGQLGIGSTANALTPTAVK
jgi:alpha-tubulin suppressor-like RCC1 family protein